MKESVNQVSNLSTSAFNNAYNVQTIQRMKQSRREGTYTAVANPKTFTYPAYISTLGAGNLVSRTSVAAAQWPAKAIAERSMGLGTSSGMGQGGTAASAAGAAGGSPA